MSQNTNSSSIFVITVCPSRIWLTRQEMYLLRENMLFVILGSYFLFYLEFYSFLSFADFISKLSHSYSYKRTTIYPKQAEKQYPEFSPFYTSSTPTPPQKLPPKKVNNYHHQTNGTPLIPPPCPVRRLVIFLELVPPPLEMT